MTNVIRGVFGKPKPPGVSVQESPRSDAVSLDTATKAAKALVRLSGSGMDSLFSTLMEGPYADIEKRIRAYAVSQESLNEAREAHAIYRMTKLELEAILDDERLNPGRYSSKPAYLTAVFHEHAAIMRGDRKAEPRE